MSEDVPRVLLVEDNPGDARLIEKRLGSRSADRTRWNKLGRKGWQLVAVDRKHAFFRREHRPRPH